MGAGEREERAAGGADSREAKKGNPYVREFSEERQGLDKSVRDE